MALIEKQEVWEYLGYYEEPDEVTLRNITRTIRTAESYVRSAVGDDLDESDPKAKELALMALGTLYNAVDMSGKGSGEIGAMASSLRMQLRVEWMMTHETV
jgi:hypothetical protein